MEPVPGLSVRVFDTGWMEITRPDSADRLLCDEMGTAMWIALCQESWRLGDAVASLSRTWEADPWSIRDQMCDWIADLTDAGVLQH
ncbi:hypothetical protein [Pseudonocardia sp. HH130630-07]|uniref:hypothetical protein n=1 Tax=Pseudonocardia sp. HH130630-07 TaxID=1690815 RepID=UPI000B3373AE|nr:hypothetical protein [Pseudonocardia sp. HH130630-07]